MALRRLFSGWLIALAALARSVAQALERASEDRSTPASNPVMAALAERYPGAPAHWLAHVAERTAQLAEAGEVPLSLNSDPATWPSVQPQALRPPVDATDRAPVSRDPAPARPTSRHEAAVPTLAALRERPSEMWRRPDLAPKRRPRPVFASPPPAVGPEPPARAAPGPGVGASARRPRSPLSVKTGAPSRPTSDPSRTRAASETTVRPEETVRPAAWADAPRNPVETLEATAAPSIPAPLTGPAPGVRTVAEERTTRDPEVRADKVQPSAAPRDRGPSIFATLVQGPVRIARFFAPRPKPMKKAASAEDAWTVIDRGGAVERGPAAVAAEPSMTFERATRDLATSAMHTSPPDGRRPIFRAPAAFQARSRAGRSSAADPAAASMAPTAGWMPVNAPRRTSAPDSERPMTLPPARPAPAFSRQDHDEPTVPVRPAQPMARQALHEASTVERAVYALNGELANQVRRSTLMASGAAPSRAAARRFADSPPEDRWPVLPPATLASPQGVAAPPPRWEELAREQEEGRWNV